MTPQACCPLPVTRRRRSVRSMCHVFGQTGPLARVKLFIITLCYTFTEYRTLLTENKINLHEYKFDGPNKMLNIK